MMVAENVLYTVKNTLKITTTFVRFSLRTTKYFEFLSN
jgi:hypothetical protein